MIRRLYGLKPIGTTLRSTERLNFRKTWAWKRFWKKESKL